MLHRVYGGPEWIHFSMVVQQTPIHFYGASCVARLRALHTSDQESYLLSIDYGPLGLSAISFIGDPENRLFFDYNSMIAAVSIMIENAIVEEDTVKIKSLELERLDSGK